ncbi:3-dehydroquinate dehydratase [Syntrophobotulus glycolicus DSM 8271]|uniref:3-dehydroquinate dehydratase n=1 Tax=Syntrophobotulus glycolicus (strain DSM 8271 / FlGlyR) TaxID=645991 RepID=F0T0S7_SYNGF|nr:type II 3-dehydroquinate dehydratase [Syntrophobotulus glycolicus]ADY56216.1 3-dehydroquinate dehydratase [Syntrophobotulus glycolicus DSM 8271]
MGSIYVFHGVNIHLLGTREPEIYGKMTLEEINQKIRFMAEQNSQKVECRQTNHEGVMVDWITALNPDDFLIINPGAWTHSSYALFDAIKGVGVPALEVHLSNIYARETFRAHSVIAGSCMGQISGLGSDSYLLALAYALEFQRFRDHEGIKNEEDK